MPELPEVEVSRLGITPHLLGESVMRVVVRNASLRWPVPAEIQELAGLTVTGIRRRAKYLLLETDWGTAILHLGMSGNLRVLPHGTPAGKHDHVDIEFANGKLLRLNDPRRFGCLLWTREPSEQHPLLAKLGPEPLTDDFNHDHLFTRSRGRKTAVKQFIMDNHTVVGVGNIYANESLFAAGIHPQREAGSISRARYVKLTEEIKTVLARAIGQGGTTLKDFTGSDGKPGYFVQELQVYGRAEQPCVHCGSLLKEIRMNGRSTVFCGRCQR
ncbi:MULTISPECIES: bifunctional DNA-formamidopyrimidine glycosylase/DNA-(apurinic or apyrimidinic site) lyase [Oceanimonas]|uniref:bifunctional DNA-formamidopyrimidine glycosylase/DNA-(apurinic or apyrimidinic site) lyase n=1 Tax=Oceanimonas TaxID=129577 RepID=UPI002936CA1C|nr:bifunctional DNA-formamidopyrimidine glycosylase/DNA-(apurinic or apyrimidinic site) lyase [Oceanimonas sp. CAM02]MDV2857707.1 bifunctional DNA-formamidopyrimidine glycosylase/DNA-(apurinic or apyrimidinic site) lyase [Oceanimonas sp. CAM02]